MSPIRTALLALPCAVLLTLMAAPAHADGEKTYKAVCIACHGTGALNAPRVGDKAKWAPLIKEGQTILTAHGYVGVRNMPAKGGKSDLTVEDFAEALVYMVNQSGGNWKKPDARGLTAIKTEITKREKQLAAAKK